MLAFQHLKQFLKWWCCACIEVALQHLPNNHNTTFLVYLFTSRNNEWSLYSSHACVMLQMVPVSRDVWDSTEKCWEINNQLLWWGVSFEPRDTGKCTCATVIEKPRWGGAVISLLCSQTSVERLLALFSQPQSTTDFSLPWNFNKLGSSMGVID